MLRRRKRPGTFTAGEEVEVRCDDEGLKGAWYEARVVGHLPKRRRYTVVYNSLTDEADESRPLEEAVTPSHIRPRPPPPRNPDGGRIGLHQPVDAFYNDGWWSGVVSKVPREQESGMYTVRFPKTRDVMAFRLSELRPHLDWVDREWVEPQTQDMRIRSGKLAGAKVDNIKQRSRSIADKPKLPPTVRRLSDGDKALTKLPIHSTNSEIKKEPCSTSEKGETIEDNTRLIDCLAKLSKTSDSLKTRYIITMPALKMVPRFQLKTFLNDKFHCSTSPFNEKSAGSPNVVTETPPKTLVGVVHEPLMPSNSNPESLMPHTTLGETEPSGKREEIPRIGGKGSENQSKAPYCSQISHGTCNFIQNVTQEQFEGVVGNEQQCKVLVSADQIRQGEVRQCGDVRELKAGKKRRKKVIPRKIKIIDTKASSEGYEPKQLDGKADEQVEEEVDMSFTLDSCSISDEIQSICHGIEGRNHADSTNHEGDSVGDRQDNRPVGDLSREGHSASQTGAITQGDTCVKDLQGQVLSMMMVCASTSNSQHNEAGIEVQNESLLSTSTGALTSPISGRPSSEKPCLPFPKRSSLWESIESMEIMSKMSQPPHFWPLEQHCKVLREGMAIGLMVTFSNLVGSIGDLKIDDPRDRYDEKVKTLAHLEEHGFDVQHAQARLAELLCIKSKHEQLVEKRSALEVVRSEKEKGKDRLDAEMEAVEKAGMALKQALAHFYEKKASLLKQREDNDSDMARLESDVRAVEEIFCSAECEFEGVLARML